MKFLKVGGVVLLASLLTTLGIMASDLTGNGNGLLGQLIATETEGPCPLDMIHVPTAGTFSCVDRFEATAGEHCPHRHVQSQVATAENITVRECVPTATEEGMPWTFVSREQAAQLCARTGKRLPTAAEWYMIAIDTADDTNKCNLDLSRAVEGKGSQCISAVGAMNTVGNVWEWVSDDVIDGVYNGRSLPSEGYVTQVDANGVASVSTDSPSVLFNDDYLWATESGVYGMMRGGYFDSQTDGGLYAVHTKTPPTLATVAIGFRCVR